MKKIIKYRKLEVQFLKSFIHIINIFVHIIFLVKIIHKIISSYPKKYFFNNPSKFPPFLIFFYARVDSSIVHFLPSFKLHLIIQSTIFYSHLKPS